MRVAISVVSALVMAALPALTGLLWSAFVGRGALAYVVLCAATLACPVVMVALAAAIGALLHREWLLTCAPPVVFGMFLVLLTHTVLNDQRLRLHGVTEQVRIVKRDADVREIGGDDNPTTYVVYRYRVVDARGVRVAGWLESPHPYPVGRRLTATVDPRGHADPVFGRPGLGWVFWALPVLQLVVLGGALRVLLPDREIKPGPVRPGPDRPPGLGRSEHVRWYHDRFGD
jgi:hypothetical protein